MRKTTIDEAIARVDDWKGKEISYKPVSGGITNPNFKVDVEGEHFFLKIPGAGTDYINREVCHEANVIADESKAGPRVYYYFEDTGVEIFQWLDGYRQVTFGDVYDKDIFQSIFERIRDFHHLETKPLNLKQSIFEQAWDMNARAKKGGYISPFNDKMEYLLSAIEKALAGSEELCPCHNDFWTNNLMYNEETDDLKIIDYEYASMNDPYVDLGLISAVNYFTEDMDVEMMKIYGGGKVDERAFARMKLNKIACDIKWAYWALYQAASSNVEFDYMNWYGQKMARLQHFWLDSRLDYWLDVAREKSIRIS